MRAWTDGALVEPSDLVIAANDRGALLGDGLFETIACEGERALFWDSHLRRLRASAQALDLALDEAALAEGARAVLAGARGRGALRLTVTRGPGGRGVAPIPRPAQRPRTLVGWSGAPAPSDVPVRLGLSPVRRNPSAPSCRHKTLSYADAVFARAEAARSGADDALMLSVSGRAACCSIGNIWVRTEEGFVTPPLSEGVLAGIVRQCLLCAGTTGGVRVRIGRLTRGDLLAFPLYRSNSLTGVQRAWLPGGAAPSPDNPLGLLYERLEREEAACGRSS